MSTGSRAADGRASAPGAERLLAAGAHYGDGISPFAGLTLSEYGRGQRLPLHAHEQGHACIVLAGEYDQSGPGQHGLLRTGCAGIVPSGVAHGNQIGPRGALCLNLALDAPATVRPRVAALSPRARGLVQRLAAGIAAGAVRREALAIECAIAELSGEILDGPTLPVLRIDRVLDALEAEAERPWTLPALAALVGRHPTHVARVFRRNVGVSIGTYRRQRRLRAVCLALRRGRASLTDIALEHGYADQSHMNREFKAAFGVSPGAWQAARGVSAATRAPRLEPAAGQERVAAPAAPTTAGDGAPACGPR